MMNPADVLTKMVLGATIESVFWGDGSGNEMVTMILDNGNIIRCFANGIVSVCDAKVGQ